MTTIKTINDINRKNIKQKYKKRSQLKEVWRSLRKNKMAIAGLIILSIFVFAAIFADFIGDYKTQVINMDISNRLQSPSQNHWFGTDEYGRDVFMRIVHGARVSLIVGFVSVSIGLITGGGLGAIAAYYGGKIDSIIMRALDILLAIPSILLSITIVTALGTNIVNLMIAVGISNVPQFARVVRASVLGVKDQEYIEASRAIGANDFVIITQHVLPNCLAPIIVYSTLSIAGSIMSIAGLSFIGLGIQPPDPEWGNMLAGGRAFIRDKVHLVMFPGIAILLTTLSFNLLGDGLRDALDPKMKY